MATNKSAAFKSCGDSRSFFDRKFDGSLLIDFYLSVESLYSIYGSDLRENKRICLIFLSAQMIMLIFSISYKLCLRPQLA
jgi:hypothetical protein